MLFKKINLLHVFAKIDQTYIFRDEMYQNYTIDTLFCMLQFQFFLTQG